MKDGHRNRKSGEFTRGLVQVEAEINDIEKKLFGLGKEQMASATKAAQGGKSMDKVIKELNSCTFD